MNFEINKADLITLDLEVEYEEATYHEIVIGQIGRNPKISDFNANDM